MELEKLVEGKCPKCGKELSEHDPELRRYFCCCGFTVADLTMAEIKDVVSGKTVGNLQDIYENDNSRV